jgi:hypothetical protein
MSPCPNNENNDDYYEMDFESGTSPSCSLSSASTEEMDLAPYLRYRAQQKLNLARKELIPTVSGRHRYDAFLERVDRFFGELRWSQPGGEERTVLSSDQMRQQRRETAERKARSDGRDPAVALRRNYAVEMWNDKRGGMSEEWEEAKEGMTRVNQRLEVVMVPARCLSRKRRRRGEDGSDDDDDNEDPLEGQLEGPVWPERR